MCALASNRDGKLCSWGSTARNNTDPKVHSHPAPCTRVNMLGDLFLEKVSTLVYFGAWVNTRSGSRLLLNNLHDGDQPNLPAESRRAGGPEKPPRPRPGGRLLPLELLFGAARLTAPPDALPCAPACRARWPRWTFWDAPMHAPAHGHASLP